MSTSDRAARLERAKALGRAAYRLARRGVLVGNVEIEGEVKRLHEFKRGALFAGSARALPFPMLAIPNLCAFGFDGLAPSARASASRCR